MTVGITSLSGEMMFLAKKSSINQWRRKGPGAVASLLTLMLLWSCTEQLENRESPRTIEREVQHKIKLDVLVDEKGNAVEVKLSEGQKSMGIFSKNAIRLAYKRTYPTKSVEGKNIQYWLKNMDAPAVSTTTN